MNVNEIMTKNPESVQVTDPIDGVAASMRDLDVGFMPILDGDILVGVVTDRDIVLRAVAEDLDIEDDSIGEIMSGNLQIVSPDTDINDAAMVMERFKIRRLPIVDDNGVLIGVISLGDIAVRTQNIDQAGEILEEVSEPAHPRRAA
ncbi:MAG TPA: CBS domain-containing protein [Candidatus Aquicultor sp.]|jgi:CBS domain-containing protein